MQVDVVIVEDQQFDAGADPARPLLAGTRLTSAVGRYRELPLSNTFRHIHSRQ
jgi:hypothetical protein